MGLAGRKVKQRIGPDPRNLAWSDNAARFGHEYLSKFGWSPSTGLGAAQDGRTSNLTIAHKLNLFGIGAERTPGGPDDIAWKQNKDFEGVLARLNQVDAGIEPEVAKEEEKGDSEEVAESSEEQKRSKKRKSKRSREEEEEESAADPKSNEGDTASAPKRNAHRAKYLASKRMANLSATAMSEILGIAPTPSSSSSSATPTPIETPIPELTVEDNIKVTNKSVNDYFKEKMMAKLAERERLAAQATPTDAGEEAKEELATSASTQDEEKRERKRRRKEEKAKLKELASQEVAEVVEVEAAEKKKKKKKRRETEEGVE